MLLACPQNEVVLCIGDVSPDGVLAYIQPDKKVAVQGSDGQTLGDNNSPASDYIGPPVFGLSEFGPGISHAAPG
ncbi:MAG: hypothetical protein U0401_18930 [Anaerolineae bacterium]